MKIHIFYEAVKYFSETANNWLYAIKILWKIHYI
jgi:hypothetical protein